MLQFDAGAIWRLGDELHLDLAHLPGIGLDLPVLTDIPADDDALGRLVRQHARPTAFVAVASAVVDVAAHARLEHPLGDFLPEQVVLRWKPTSDAFGEEYERLLD